MDLSQPAPGLTPDTSEPEPQAPVKPKSKHAGTKQLVQAANLQRFAYNAAMALQQACTEPGTGRLVMSVQAAAAVHKLIGAWDTAADRVRVLKGKGLPSCVKSASARPAAQAQPVEAGS